jgi:hypothetical protein
MTTSIALIELLPGSPYNGSGFVGIVITSGVPSFFKVVGANLQDITSVNWYPKNPGTVDFEMRQLITVDNTVGTFMVMVTNNRLNTDDRSGYLSFRVTDGTTISFPVKTFGRVSVAPLWTDPGQGLITG